MVTKNMDLEAALLTVIVSVLSVIVQTIVIIWLYNHYIIPKIVIKVKDEILTAINSWVEDLKGSLAQNVKEAVENGIEYLKQWISGKRGTEARQVTLAKEYLDNRLPQDPNDDAAAWDEIIAQGVMKYGMPIVNAALKSIRPKAQKADTAAAADGWS